MTNKAGRWWSRVRGDAASRRPEGGRAVSESRAGWLEELPACAFETDPEGVITAANGRFQQAVGRDGRALVGSGLVNLFSEHERQALQARLAPRQHAGPIEPLVVSRAGRQGMRSFELHLQARLNSSDQLRGFTGVAVDITARLRTRESQQNQLDFATRRLEISPVAVFAKDAEGRYTKVNNAFVNLVGLPEAMLIGSTGDQLYRPDDGRRKASDQHVMTSGETTAYETEFTTASGVKRTVLITKARLTDGSSQTAGILGSAQDVTLYRRAEQAILAGRDAVVRAAKTKLDFERSFLSMAAHELRTPITGLRLQAELIRGAGTQAEIRDRSLDLLASVDRASHVLEQLMVLSRVDGMKYSTMDIRPVDLELTYFKVMSELQEEAAERGTRLKARLAHMSVEGVEFGIYTLLRNLLHNAIAYTPPGGEVQVTATQEAQGLLLTVDDSGPGIPESQRDKAFDRFDRLGQQAVKGSGLGLSIVKTIVIMHGASIQLSSSRLGGLRVSVQFGQGQMPSRHFLDSNLAALQEAGHEGT